MTLDQLPVGERATVLGVDGEPALRLRIEAMGLRAGREVSVIRQARRGGPLQVRIGLTDLIIRISQARLVRLSAAPPGAPHT
jgi:Fe2+ transport system protein FeoA